MTPGVYQMCSNISLEFESLAVFLDNIATLIWCAIPGHQTKCIQRKSPELQIR